MKKHYFISILLTFSITAFTQTCEIDNWDKYLGISYLPIGFEPDHDLLKISYENLKDCEQYLSTDQHLAKLNSMLGFYSHYLHMSKVSTISYIKKSYKLDKNWFCRTYCEETAPAEKDDHFEIYFVANYKSDISDILKECGCEPEVRINTEEFILLPEYAESLSALEINDQKYRKLGGFLNRKEQNRLDSINRIELDSLFEVYGFPSIANVGEKANTKAWLILQHSSDCDWNEKWVLRNFEAYKNGINSRFYNTMERFYHKKSGFCIKENSDQSKEFLKILKTNFPDIIELLILNEILP